MEHASLRYVVLFFNGVDPWTQTLTSVLAVAQLWRLFVIMAWEMELGTYGVAWQHTGVAGRTR